ncbi:hypothetical protein GUJ93_ZPchr0012g21295 [Zizania palustris]|uniref:Uncharacterized protein n=1 Tax=Zizania palustris TaxID=103762 RepID=A0A8J5WLZ8_ZIZPA|nr:hypothetical protein GUJ93_ZPchr0012g21295 [Zizania palustris]
MTRWEPSSDTIIANALVGLDEAMEVFLVPRSPGVPPTALLSMVMAMETIRCGPSMPPTAIFGYTRDSCHWSWPPATSPHTVGPCFSHQHPQRHHAGPPKHHPSIMVNRLAS